MKTIRPLRDKVLIRRSRPDERTKGGIIIPASAQEKPTEAVVLAVGPGRPLPDGTIRPIDVKKGDRVIIGKFSGTPIKIEIEDKVEALVVHEDDILAVLEA